MKKIFLTVFFSPAFLYAQNLITNSSFEFSDSTSKVFCPNDFSEINKLVDWWTTVGTSDIFCSCNNNANGKINPVGAPSNGLGYQLPHSGKCYAGFCAYLPPLKGKEYIQTKFVKKLSKGKKYSIQFYLSLADYSKYQVQTISAYFSKNKVDGKNGINLLNLKPQVTNEIFTLNDTCKWFLFSGTYTANGSEEYLVVGSFKIDGYKNDNSEPPNQFKNKKHLQAWSNYNLAYYYVDDVSLTELIEDSVQNELDPKIGEAILLNNIFFEVDKSELLPKSSFELNKLVQYLKDNPETTIEIDGHTDSIGNEEHNKNLSKARAKAVADYLTQKGIDKTRITYNGYGSSKPIITNDTDAGRQQNRRVEFIISKK